MQATHLEDAENTHRKVGKKMQPIKETSGAYSYRLFWDKSANHFSASSHLKPEGNYTPARGSSALARPACCVWPPRNAALHSRWDEEV